MRIVLLNSFDKASGWRYILWFEVIAWIIGLCYYLFFLFLPERIMGQPLKDDPMAVYGFGLLLAGLICARLIQRTFEEKVKLMFASGAIESGFLSMDQFKKWFHSVSLLSFLGVSVTLIPLTLLGIYHVDSNDIAKGHLMAGSFVGLWMVSTRFAHGVSTGIAAFVMAKPSCRFHLSPTHPDRSSGFGHLGYYYFEQALVLLLPAIYMTFWIVFIGINVGSLQRSDLIERVEAAIEERAPLNAQTTYVIDQYVACSDGSWDVSSCEPEQWEFIWYDQFVRLIIYNLLIFLLAWITPSYFIQRRMIEARERSILPLQTKLEIELHRARKEMNDQSNSVSAATETYERASVLTLRLAELRSTPTFPIPLSTAVTTWISNVSALLGFISLG